MRRRYKVVCFDLDGTLLPDSSVSLWLAEQMGHGPGLTELEARFRAGMISNSVTSMSTTSGDSCLISAVRRGSRCQVCGDRRFPLQQPLFREVGLAIAFNGTAAAREAAHVHIDGGDLQAVLPAIIDPGERP